MEMKRINDICPVCGKRYVSFNISFYRGIVARINAECECGYFARVDEPKIEIFADSESICVEEDAVDRWNRVTAK